MNDYEAVVIDYIAADRAVFVNPQCLIQLNAGGNPDTTGLHWYCDALAVDFRERCIFLCETTFSASLGALLKRLQQWRAHWPELRNALSRDSRLPPEFSVRIWLFVPGACLPRLVSNLQKWGFDDFAPRITPLESVQPWTYCSWDRLGEAPKPEIIPESMR